MTKNSSFRVKYSTRPLIKWYAIARRGTNKHEPLWASVTCSRASKIQIAPKSDFP